MAGHVKVPEFSLWVPYGDRRELIPTSDPLTSTCTPTHAHTINTCNRNVMTSTCTLTHAHTHTVNTCNKNVRTSTCTPTHMHTYTINACNKNVKEIIEMERIA